jgi:hypothetical protein
MVKPADYAFVALPCLIVGFSDDAISLTPRKKEKKKNIKYLNKHTKCEVVSCILFCFWIYSVDCVWKTSLFHLFMVLFKSYFSLSLQLITFLLILNNKLFVLANIKNRAIVI